ncbi:MAG: SDR family oxidoreductase [Trueperaceae bacterium]|nr:MAG: SDR family oxidoreductase [Trueperaceae bacterium]
MLLEGKVVLVTGSSTGIGKAIADTCSLEGAKVMVHGLEPGETEAAARELGCPFLACDLRAAESAPALIQATLAHYGRIDAVVNNAASTKRSDLETTDAGTFDDIVAVNLRAPLLLIREALPHFRAQGGGSVVNIGSVNAYCGEPNLLAYSISKGGLMTLTRNLADAYGSEKIRFNQLNLGWTLSENEIALKVKEGLAPDWYLRVPEAFAPSGALIRPEQVAAHAVFWLSEASAPVTGSVLELEQYPIIGRNPGKEN